MKTLILVLLVSLLAAAANGVFFGQGSTQKFDSNGCPIPDPSIAWGCMKQDKCFGDASCGAGHKCCPHICGDFCHRTVHCDAIHCNLKCHYGLQRDAKGCDVCTCSTTKPCSGPFATSRNCCAV